MALSNYTTTIQAGVVTALGTDAYVKVTGTLGVKLIEVEKPQPEGAIPDLLQAQLPYIGVMVTGGDIAPAGTGPTYRAEYKIQLRCALEKADSDDATTACQDITDRAVACIVACNGTVSAIVSGSQVFIESASVGEVKTGEYDNPYLAQSISTVTAYILST